MNKYTGRLTGPFLLVGVLMVALIGCSTDAPSSSSSTAADLASLETAQFPTPPDSKIQFVATLATIDYVTKELTFEENELIVYAAEECEVVHIVAGIETVIPFDDLKVGDRVKVCGLTQDDGTVLANKICLYDGEYFCQYDLAFRDTIATIDYDNSSFTVYNRDETIVVDAATIIWGIEVSWHQEGSDDDPDKTAAAASQSSDDPKREHEIGYLFSDLKPGDVVEVKASIIDESMLAAINIKLANSNLQECAVFEARLASIDLDLRSVTFADYDWIGLVCNGAILTDSEGSHLELEDFAIQDRVLVRGIPVTDEGDKLRISEMSQLD